MCAREVVFVWWLVLVVVCVLISLSRVCVGVRAVIAAVVRRCHLASRDEDGRVSRRLDAEAGA